MARNIRWRCSFMSLKGVSCVINIYDNDWSGGIVSVTGADDPFYFEEDNSDDILNEVIRYRTGYIRLVEQGVFGALKDIYPTSTFDRFVEVLYDGAVVFYGYIQVQDFSNDLVPNPRVIELPVISPLGLCDKLRFNAIIPPVMKTLGELLDIMLYASSVTLQGYQKVVVPDMNGTDLSQTVMSLFVSPWNDDYWHSMTTQTWSKVMSPETYDVLIDGICKAFGWICHDTPTALVFTSFEHRGNYISYPIGHVGESGYGTTVSIPSLSQLTTYFNPADDEANVSTIQPDTGIEIDYEGEFGSIEFSFDRTYFGGVEMIDAADPREIVSLCNLIPIDGLFEVNDVGTLSFDSTGKVNIGKACVAWNGHEGVLVSLGSAPSGSILFKVRYYTKKISGNGWMLSYDLMTSMRNIAQLKNDEDNIKYKYIGTDYNRTDNYVEITFKYYHVTIDPLPSQYLLFFHNIRLEALSSNEPYAKYKYLPATDSDKIPDTNPPISSSITMPISKYRLNDRLIGDVLRTDKITEYPYLFQPRQNMIHKFKTTSSSVPELFHAMLFAYFNNNWRIIAQDFHPWDDEYTLTLQNSPILDSSPAPGPSPDPQPQPDPQPTPTPPGPTPTPGPSGDNPVISINIRITNNKSEPIVLDGEVAFVLGNPDHNGHYLGWMGEYNTTSHIRFIQAPVTIGPGQTATFNGLTWNDDGNGMGEKSPLDPSKLYLADRPRNVLFYVNGVSETILANNMDPSIIFTEGGTYDIVIP